MNIYLDMDDVVADWIGYAQEFLKLRWDHEKGERVPQSDWDKLKNDSRFYLNLPLKEGAHELVDYCKSYCSKNGTNLYFLSALPHDYSMPYAAQDKVWWANRHFPGVPVFLGPFSHDKWRHCKNEGDILIDDRHSNCHEWQAQGGNAHIYTTWENCKPWLTSILNSNEKK
jgi:hypothetical protein